MGRNQVENMKEAFDCNEVVRVHLLELVQANDAENPMDVFAAKMGMPAGLIDDAAWQIIGHTPTEVTVLVCYDLTVAMPWRQD
jgi:hypothetical protein